MIQLYTYIHFFKIFFSIMVNSTFFFSRICFFIYYLFLAALGLRWCTQLSPVVASRGPSSLRCAGLSLRWFLPLRSMGSRRTGFSSCASPAPECKSSSCGTRAQLLCGMWDLPRPGLEPMSPALAGGFLTTVPQGKPKPYFLDSFLHSSRPF